MRLLIRADASSKIGTGHAMRCLALAQAWQKEIGEVTLLLACQSPNLEARFQSENMEVAHLSVEAGSIDDAEKTATIAKRTRASWLVLDGYQFGSAYQQIIERSGIQFLFVDDYGHADYYYADLILNQNLSAHENLYHRRSPKTQLLLGTSYSLLRQDFLHWRTWQRTVAFVAKKILVTLGGSDLDNVTLKVIQSLNQLEINNLDVTVVVGGSNIHYEELLIQSDASHLSISLQHDVNNMPELIAWADIAITGGGSTCWELAFLGLPNLVLVLAENQRAIAEKLNEMGIAINLGWYRDISIQEIGLAIEKLIPSYESRKQMSKLGQSFIDGYGSNKVVSKMKEMATKIETI